MSFYSSALLLDSNGAAWLSIGDAIVKATLLLAAAGVASVLLRRASAAVRHFVWTMALLGALAVPLLSVALPRWEMPIVTVASPAPASAEPPLANAPAPPIERTSPGGRRDTPERTAPAGRAAQPTGRPDIDWQEATFALWTLGVLAILARVAAGVIAVQWMSRRTENVVDAPWLPLARDLAAEVGVSAGVVFLRSRSATMPMAWGIVKPAVLMPADADDWPLDRLRIVLLHELAHVKRRDCLTHLLAQVSCAFYWFNPLAWMAARHVRTERERACDDLVLAAGTDGPDYAEELLEIARVMRAGRFPAVLAGATLAMAHRSQLEGRLMAILDPKVPRAGLSRLRAAAVTAMCACALVPLASLQPWAYADGGSVQAAAVTDLRALQQPNVPPAPNPNPNPKPAPMPMPRPAPDGPVGAEAESVVQGVVQGTVQGTVQGVLQGMAGRFSESIGEAASQAVQDAVGGKRSQKANVDPKTVAALTAALNDSDKDVREMALQALVRMRDPSIFEPLVQALRDESPDVREQAAHGLGQLRDRRAIEPLTAALKDSNANVREQAVFALGQLRARESVGPLTSALKDADADVREQAAFALGQLRDPSSVDPLVAALKDSNANVREQAAFGLGQIRDRRAVAALSAALSDPSDDVRERSVFALGQMRDPATSEALAAALRDSKGNVREQAAFALGQLRDKRAVSPLISALKDADTDVREQAAFALGQIRDASAVEALVVALKDANASVRERAAFALGQIRDPRAIDALTEALKDASADVRQQAAFALGQIAR